MSLIKNIKDFCFAGVAELADASDLKSDGTLVPVSVRVRPPAPFSRGRAAGSSSGS